MHNDGSIINVGNKSLVVFQRNFFCKVINEHSRRTMGQSSSNTLEGRIRDDPVFMQLCGETSVVDHQVFWKHYLRQSLSALSLTSGSSSITLPLINPRLVEQCLSPLADSLCMSFIFLSTTN